MSGPGLQEATELAYFGAQVLHPQSMRPAMDSDRLCVRVKNSYNVRAPVGPAKFGGPSPAASQGLTLSATSSNTFQGPRFLS